MDAENFCGEKLPPELRDALSVWLDALQIMPPPFAVRNLCMALAMIYRFRTKELVTKEEFIDAVAISVRNAMDVELIPLTATAEEEWPHK